MTDRPKIEHFSLSAVKTYNKCARRYWYQYLTGMESVEQSRPLALGSLVHAGFEGYLRARLRWLGTGGREALLEQAKAAMKEEARENNLMDYYFEALSLVEFYTSEETLLNTGTPTEWIEHEFVDEFAPGIRVKGIIDALLQWDGRLFLVDWKVRGRFTDDEAILNDSQLYLYAWYVREKLGLKIDGAFQYQLLSGGPSRLSTNRDGSLPKRFGKTTHTLLARDAEDIASDYPDKHRAADVVDAYIGSIVDMGYFVRVSPIDLERTDYMVNEFLKTCRTILADRSFVPVHDAWVCGYCPFLQPCLKHSNKGG